MRPLPLLVLAAVVSAAVAAAISVLTSRPSPPAPDVDVRIERLQAELDALRNRQSSRTERRHALETTPAPAPLPTLPSRAPAVRRPAGVAPGAASADDAPRAFLQRYLRSFENEEQGSEFFRLAVEAFAPEMVPELAAVVVDPGQPAGARVQLARLLGAPAFRGDPTAIRALLDSLRANPSDELAKTVFTGLRVIGDHGVALELEALSPFLERSALRTGLYGTLAVLAPESANAALLRLLPGEKKEMALQWLVGALNGADPASALAVIRQASVLEAVPVRNRAAEKLGTLHTPEARQFLNEWLPRETAYSVLGRLTAARAEWDAVPKYSAQRMVGPADVENPASDHENAWCPKTKDGGREWVLLTYSEPLIATYVRVHEVYAPGAVVAVEVEDEFGAWHVGWEGTDPLTEAGVFEVKLRPLDRPVKRVRVLLDTSLRGGWHEIDAVELVGPDGRAWAAEAAASSTYGDP